jgi:type II secretory pathway predicted ATPase ExeA
MKNDKKLANTTVKGIENPKMSTKQLHDALMKQLDSMQTMIASLDSRERLLQKMFERLDQKVDDLIKERARDDTQQTEAKGDLKWMAATIISIALFIVSTIINAVK